MGLFGRLFGGKTEAAPAPPEPEAPAAPPVHLVVLREGMSTPREDEVAALVRAIVPEHAAVPARGLAQPRWWRQDDWISGGLRAVGAALADELGVDPDETTWELGKDEKGARVAIVLLYPKAAS